MKRNTAATFRCDNQRLRRLKLALVGIEAVLAGSAPQADPYRAALNVEVFYAARFN
jgi:hypothetical protein